MDRSVDPIVLPACVNCGAARAGPYCTHCGQREIHRPHTLRSMIGGVVDRMLNLDRGIVHTAFRLTAAPGDVVREYLAGRTVPYTHPFGYLLLAFAAFAVAARLLGGAQTGAGSDIRFFTLLLVPFVAAVSWLLFRRTGLTFAEHLILDMYLFGHVALLLALMHVAVPLASGTALSVLVTGALAAGFGYFVWGYSRVFRTRPLLAAIGGIAALAGGTVLWGAAVAALVRVLRH
jgi:hypothetical protein